MPEDDPGSTAQEYRHRIRDRRGRVYDVDEDRESIWTFEVWARDHRVAYAYCLDHSPVMKLQDFRVENRCVVPETWSAKVWRKWWGIAAPRVSFRGQGVGSALLELIVERATAGGLQRIEGDVYPGDYHAFPGLLDWYRQRGFRVRLHSPDGGRIAAIDLTLPAKAPQTSSKDFATTA